MNNIHRKLSLKMLKDKDKADSKLEIMSAARDEAVLTFILA
jgi:hypothetical protein